MEAPLATSAFSYLCPSSPSSRAAARALGHGLALWAALTVAVATHPNAPGGLLVLLGLLGLTGVVAAIASPSLRASRSALEFGVGPAVLALCQLAIVFSGGLGESLAGPLTGLWMALVAAFARGRTAIVTGVVGAASAGLGLWFGAVPLQASIVELGYLLVFGALSTVLYRGRVVAFEARREAAVAEALEAVERDAREFRLAGASSAPEPAQPRSMEALSRMRQVGSVRAIKEALVDVLGVARVAVRADTALLFLLDEHGERLKLRECVARAGAAPVPVGATVPLEGALGAVIRSGRPVGLAVRENRGLGYPTTARVGSLLALPLGVAPGSRGVLVVDRQSTAPFTSEDEEVLRAVAREAERAMEAERIFASMDRDKYEQERFYEAFSLLNEALSVEAFAERLIDASARIKGTELFAVTLFDAAASEHTVVAARARTPEVTSRLRGSKFTAKEGGLVEMALKTGHTLPYAPAGPRASVFGRLALPPLSSVKVLPMIHQGEPLGALVLGAFEREDEVTREEQRMLETVVAHATTTLAHARLFAKMEAMATTDGLTGLVNHRRFQELLAESLARATRFGREVSVLMVDADHFKAINDTYGHPVGDVVLKRIAQVLKSEARRTDVVARYGGEEFVVILDETGTDGGRQVAERIRKRIEAEVVQGEFGRVRVTASLGLATWPTHAETQAALLERADQALYEAKREGRNRVVFARTRTRDSLPISRRGEHVAPSPGVQL